MAMHRRISALVNSASGSSSTPLSYRVEEKLVDNDASSAHTVVREEGPVASLLKIKRVDYYYSRWTKSWKYRVRILSEPHSLMSEYQLESRSRERSYRPYVK